MIQQPFRFESVVLLKQSGAATMMRGCENRLMVEVLGKKSLKFDVFAFNLLLYYCYYYYYYFHESESC